VTSRRHPGVVRTGLIAVGAMLTGMPAADAADALRAFREGASGFVRENLSRVVAIAPRSEDHEVLRGYAAWALEVFSSEESHDPEATAPDVVCANDGLTNLEKYALGLDPHLPITAEMRPETGQLEEHFFLWYCRPSDTDDVDYRVEASTDGVNWSSEGVTQEPILANEFAESWQAHYHAAPGQQVWLRLVVALR